MQDLTEVTKTIALLYELSLATGTSLELEANSKHFFKIFMRRLNLAYVSVWLHKDWEEVDPSGKFIPIYSYPQSRLVKTAIDKDAPLLQQLTKLPYLVLSPEEYDHTQLPKTDNGEEGQHTLYRLGNIGFLHFYANTKVPEVKVLNALQDVMKKFTLSLEACIAHHRTHNETNKRLKI